MNVKLCAIVTLSGVFFVSVVATRAQAQYPIMEKVAQHVVEKYRTSSCAELASRRGQPPSAMEERAVKMLQEDPAMRTAFINRVAAPIANRLFDCHLIP
jgi:hypothetical protein